MTTSIRRSGDCGNSPKQKRLEDLAVALAAADIRSVEVLTVPDLDWRRAGRKPVHGQDDVISAIRQAGAASEVIVERVVSHGRAGAVSGTLTRAGKRTAFCHMFEFHNAKGTHVQSISTYAIGLR